jgi:uncharacterized membrane protein YkvA (DUF1232 family)
MSIITELKTRTKKLKQEIQALYYVYQDPRVGWLAKALIIFTLAYALSPIDLIPDFIPILGYLDDLIIIPFLITLSIKIIPKDILEECRQKAIKTPISLRKNWVMGVGFILIWILVVVVIIKPILQIIF